MSNQVDSNQQSKYVAQPGVTIWFLTADQVITAAASTTKCLFNNPPPFNQGNGEFLRYDPATMMFEVMVPGSFSMNFLANLNMTTVAQPFHFDIGIEVFSGQLASTSIAVRKIPLPAASVASPAIQENAAATIYLRQGVKFFVYFTNYNASDTLKLNMLFTKFLVSKVT